MTPRMGPDDGLAEEAARAVRAVADVTPAAAVVLGSGLGPALDGMTVEAEIEYPSIPGFPRISVPGHAGRLALGTFAGVPVAAFRGRVHYYEGHPMATVTLPTRLAAELGARVLVATAAVGSLDPMLEEGTLVVGSDHLNFLGENPLRGWRDERGWPAFVDIANAYDASLAERALVAAEEVGLPATRGVYVSVAGPSFETRAEMEFLRTTGATVVGMSVVPEVVAATALGLRCVGMFCVTNRVGEGVSHEEVMAVGARVAEPLGRVLERVLSEIS